MSPDTLRFLLQIAGVFIGGGAVQLTIFILRRRSELKNLDATSGSTALTSANTYIGTLQAGEAAARLEIQKLQVRLDAAEAKREDEDRRSTRIINAGRDEIDRLTADLARTRSNLAIANAQINELEQQLANRGNQ
jgi:predicted  nucleic acid-binding Zn-ribbon protein